MSAGVKGTKGVVFNLTMPPEIMERIDRVARASYSTRTEYLRRFLISNIDVIDPEPPHHAPSQNTSTPTS